MDVPVFLINGFLESGKTTFINTTLEDPEFTNNERILVISCEEGIEEYNLPELEKRNIFVVSFENKEDINQENFNKLKETYKPQRVIIELNGMWKFAEVLSFTPPIGWMIVQMITIVDASTFNNYLLNMRGLIMEQVKYSDTIIFNRCDQNTKKLEIRRAIKPVNRKAQLIYETLDGIDTSEEEEELPFDVNADPIVIEEDDFGLWYIDILDYPKKYEGKTIDFKAMVYKDKKLSKNTFVPGRFAMQCCADDIAFIGFQCKYTDEFSSFMDSKNNKDWVHVTAKIRMEFKKEYRGKGPVLYATNITDDKRAEEEIVYFS